MDSVEDCGRLGTRLPTPTSLLSRYILTEEQKYWDGFPYIDQVNNNVLVHVSNPNTNCGRHGTNQCDYFGLIQYNDRLIIKAQCERCRKAFYLETDTTYITREVCLYHWGKLEYTPGSYIWSCCQKTVETRGCSVALDHVWRGLVKGINLLFSAPFFHIHHHGSGDNNPDDRVYGIACNTIYTTRGVELVEIVLVNVDGQMVYASSVKPTENIIDYNTRFTGITEDYMKNVQKSIYDVREEVQSYLKEDTLLIGHCLESDLQALRMTHRNCIDITTLYPNSLGYPHRHELGFLTTRYLNRPLPMEKNLMKSATAIVDLAVLKVFLDQLPLVDRVVREQLELSG